MKKETPTTEVKGVLHTPGEWKVEKHIDHYGVDILNIAAGGWHIANINPFAPENSNSEANARLIAAAPELKQALNDALLLLEAYTEQYRGETEDKTEVARLQA